MPSPAGKKEISWLKPAYFLQRREIPCRNRGNPWEISGEFPIFASEINKTRVMITMLFLIIAFAMSPFFLHKSDKGWDRVLYYILSIILTPLIGPFVYKCLSGPKTTGKSDRGSFVCGDAGL